MTRLAKKKQNQEPRPILQLKIDGPGMRKGRVPIPELILICKEAQNAINKQAEALRKKKTYHPGPIDHSIQEECTLELIAIHGNSPTTLDFDLRKPQRALDFREEFGTVAIREVAKTIAGLRKKGVDGFDPGVLLRLYSLTGAITPKLISQIDWIAPGHNGHGRKLSAAITKTVRASVAKRLSSPRKAPVEVDGVLEMADFKKEEYKCRIDPPIGLPVLCTFDPKRADEIYNLLRKYVRVKGEGTIHPYTDKIEVMQIGEIIPLSPMALSDQSFFANPSIADLMAANNVQPLNDLSVLAGGIPPDEDVDEMLKVIYDARSR
jgi:hypothetical protein